MYTSRITQRSTEKRRIFENFVRVVAPVCVRPMSQTDLFKNGSYSIEPCARKNLKKQLHKKTKIWTYNERYSQTSTQKNKLWQVDMLLKQIDPTIMKFDLVFWSWLNHLFRLKNSRKLPEKFLSSISNKSIIEFQVCLSFKLVSIYGKFWISKSVFIFNYYLRVLGTYPAIFTEGTYEIGFSVSK